MNYWTGHSFGTPCVPIAYMDFRSSSYYWTTCTFEIFWGYEPENPKANYRLGKAFVQLKDFEQVNKDFE